MRLLLRLASLPLALCVPFSLFPGDAYSGQHAVERAAASAYRTAAQQLQTIASLDEDAAVSLLTLAGDLRLDSPRDGSPTRATFALPTQVLHDVRSSDQAPWPLPSPAPAVAWPEASHLLLATSNTTIWGYFSRLTPAALYVASGDIVNVELLSPEAGDFPAGCIEGDANIEDIYRTDAAGQARLRGASGVGDGVHILTGPIHVDGAEPGDWLAIDVLALRPRINPKGQAFGVNSGAWWGMHHGSSGGPLGRGSAGPYPGETLTLQSGDPAREVSFIYQIQFDEATGLPTHALPAFRFQYGQPVGSLTHPCITGGDGSLATQFGDCVNGSQVFTSYSYPGLITKTNREVDRSVAGRWRLPVNMHLGLMGLAPEAPDYVSTNPPMGAQGGNLDNRRVAVGNTLYLRVAIPGGMLSMGDAHAAMGDSELSGTGIEIHADGTFRLRLIKAGAGDSSAGISAAAFAALDAPLIVTSDGDFVIHGLSVRDYLKEMGFADTACDGTKSRLRGGNSTFSPIGCPHAAGQAASEYGRLDAAAAHALHAARTFLHAQLGSDALVESVMGKGEWAVTQAVDGNVGVHVTLAGADARPKDRKEEL